MKCEKCGERRFQKFGSRDKEYQPCRYCSGELKRIPRVNLVKPIKEVCEYIYTNKDKIALRGCTDVWEDTFMVKRWKYCPYCTKPISIKGE